MNNSFYFLLDWSFDTLLLYLAIAWPLVPKLTRMSTFCVVTLVGCFFVKLHKMLMHK